MKPGMILSVAPGLDSLAFRFGIPYESQWGQHGFAHSLLPAIVVGTVSILVANAVQSDRWSEGFFTERGSHVLKSEFIYVWLPALSLGLVFAGLRKRLQA
jgi:hypothetical protein